MSRMRDIIFYLWRYFDMCDVLRHIVTLDVYFSDMILEDTCWVPNDSKIHKDFVTKIIKKRDDWGGGQIYLKLRDNIYGQPLNPRSNIVDLIRFKTHGKILNKVGAFEFLGLKSTWVLWNITHNFPQHFPDIMSRTMCIGLSGT